MDRFVGFLNLLKNRIDSARYYLALAEAHTTDIRDMADLQYTAYRIEAQARNFEKATEKIHHYIYLTDSLTRSNMQFSAGMVERDYFKERSKFAEYRMKNRTIWEIAVATVILLIIGVAYYESMAFACCRKLRQKLQNIGICLPLRTACRGKRTGCVG